MPKYYIAPNKRGRLIKIVEDVDIPIQKEKLNCMGHLINKITKQALIARFVNEDMTKKFMDAYNQVYGDDDDEN